jgi:hypothetical protein
MTGYWPLSIVEHGIGLNITLMSYVGEIGIGFTAASCLVPQPQELVTDILAAHSELRRHALPHAPRRAAKQKRAATKALEAGGVAVLEPGRAQRKASPISAASAAAPKAGRGATAKPARGKSGHTKATRTHD